MSAECMKDALIIASDAGRFKSLNPSPRISLFHALRVRRILRRFRCGNTTAAWLALDRWELPARETRRRVKRRLEQSLSVVESPERCSISDCHVVFTGPDFVLVHYPIALNRAQTATQFDKARLRFCHRNVRKQPKGLLSTGERGSDRSRSARKIWTCLKYVGQAWNRHRRRCANTFRRRTTNAQFHCWDSHPS